MGKSYSGVDGTVTFGSADASVTGFSFDAEAVSYNSRTTSDLGWDHTSTAYFKVSGSFDAFFHADTNPFSAAGLVFQVTPKVYPTVRLNTGGGKFASGEAQIGKISVKSATDAGITYTCSFTSRGSWSLPT